MEINLIYGGTYLNSGEFVAQPGLSFSVSGFALWKIWSGCFSGTALIYTSKASNRSGNMGIWCFGSVICPSAQFSHNSICSRSVWPGYIGNRGFLLGLDMEPSWRELKQILRRSEEISEANCSALQQLMVKFGNLEQSFTQRIERLETECQFLRSLVLPQPLQSLSINQVSATSRHGNLEDGQGDLEAAPMEVEEDSPQQSGVQGVHDNVSSVS